MGVYPERMYRIDYLHHLNGDGLSFEVPEMLAYRMAQEGFCLHGNIINTKGEEITGPSSSRWEWHQDWAFDLRMYSYDTTEEEGESDDFYVIITYLGKEVRGYGRIENAILNGAGMTREKFIELLSNEI